MLNVDSPLFVTNRTRLVEAVAKSGLPAIYPARAYVEAGGLMSYGSNVPKLWRRAAVYVDKILKGAKPGDLPVEQSTTFELAINSKTVTAIGLTVPPSIVLRADRIVDRRLEASASSSATISGARRRTRRVDRPSSADAGSDSPRGLTRPG